MATSMPLVSAEVETINVEEKEYAVKGYTLKQDLSNKKFTNEEIAHYLICLLYTSPSPRDGLLSRMPSSA